MATYDADGGNVPSSALEELMPKVSPKAAATQGPAIRTKFSPPRAARRVVRRSAILETLQLGLDRRVTVLRAPSGFGKTTVLADWREQLRADQRLVAWVTLDADDNEPDQFVAYLTRALANALDSLADQLPEFFTDSEAASPRARLVSVINALDELSIPACLILDDYDRIQSGEVHDLMSFLLLNAPANLHLVISSRAEPPLPLAYLRAHDELVEIDVTALRFAIDDTRQFFGELSNVSLDPGQTRALHEATEGWVAGLQIAAIALRGRGDADALIAGFSGQFRAVNAYLAEVVLPSLTPETVDVLLRLSILERFNGPLCEVVTGQAGGAARVLQLHQQNLFLQALDDEDRWFRFHALFGDFLRGELARRLPDEVAHLHEHAARWLAAAGLWREAVRHALEAERVDLAAQWVERCAMREVEDSRVHELLAWASKLPAEAVRGRLQLRLAVAWALLLTIQVTEAVAAIDALSAEIAAGEFDQDPHIETELMALRFCITALQDETAAALPIGEACLLRLHDMPTRDDHAVWVQQAVLNGLTHCYHKAGRVDEARAMQRAPRYPASRDLSRNLFTQCYRVTTLCACDQREARLHDAARQMRETLRVAQAQAGRRSAAATLVACSLAAVHYEWNELEEVEQMLADRLDVVDEVCFLDSVRSAYLALARLAMVRGDHDEAHSVLDRAERVADRRGWSRLLAIVLAERVRVWLIQGFPAEADACLARLNRVTPSRAPAEPSVSSETWRVRGIAGARCALQHRGPGGAVRLLQAVLESEDPERSPYPCARTRALLAVALEADGQRGLALDQLEALLRVAEMGQMLRSIADEGAPLAALMGILVRVRPEALPPPSDWRTRLFDVLGLDPELALDRPPRRAAPTSHPELIEPLSKRERDVLTLVAKGLSNEQTARALSLGIETVKWHLKNVYGKLGVTRRTLAVHRARQMDLIETDTE